LSAAERAQLESLACDLPSLWNSPETSVIDKRQIVHLLLKQVIVWAPSLSEEMTIECHWVGDVITRYSVTRPVRRWKQLRRYHELLARISELRELGWKSNRIAEQLNVEGFYTPRGAAITALNVRKLLSRTVSSRGTGLAAEGKGASANGLNLLSSSG
jgi:hypothetical protein